MKKTIKIVLKEEINVRTQPLCVNQWMWKFFKLHLLVADLRIHFTAFVIVCFEAFFKSDSNDELKLICTRGKNNVWLMVSQLKNEHKQWINIKRLHTCLVAKQASSYFKCTNKIWANCNWLSQRDTFGMWVLATMQE